VVASVGGAVWASVTTRYHPRSTGRSQLARRACAGVAVPCQRLQTAAVGSLKCNGNSSSHAPDSHAFSSRGIPSGFKCQTQSTRRLDYYRKTFDAPAVFVSILASFDVRADRVAVRSEKTMTREKACRKR
jgi:hypothetical protein